MSSIAQFLARYSPEIAAQLQSAREHLASHFARGYELVYDNYNALGFGFSTSDKASGVVISVVGYPGWVTLFFLKGVLLHDPEKRLQGAGSQVRSIRLQPSSVLMDPAVQALIAQAIASVGNDLAKSPLLTTVIKSASAKQRPRRPPLAAGESRSAQNPKRRKAAADA